MVTGFLTPIKWPCCCMTHMDTTNMLLHFYFIWVSAHHIVPKQQAWSCKCHRFYNGIGVKDRNISLDYKKELQHSGLKSMWRQLGPNLNETSAERIAGTLQTIELSCESIDRDCVKDKNHGHRTSSKDRDAVKQIVNGLITYQAFKKINGCEGYSLFPEFHRSLMHELDHRHLCNWMQELTTLQGSNYPWTC